MIGIIMSRIPSVGCLGIKTIRFSPQESVMWLMTVIRRECAVGKNYVTAEEEVNTLKVVVLSLNILVA